MKIFKEKLVAIGKYFDSLGKCVNLFPIDFSNVCSLDCSFRLIDFLLPMTKSVSYALQIIDLYWKWFLYKMSVCTDRTAHIADLNCQLFWYLVCSDFYF